MAAIALDDASNARSPLLKYKVNNMWKFVVVVVLSLFAASEAFSVAPATCRQRAVSFSFARDYASRILQAVSTPAQQETATETAEEESANIIGNVVFLLPSENADETPTKFGTKSPVDCPSVVDAAAHLVRKASWFSDQTVDASIVYIPTQDSEDFEQVKANLLDVDVLIALGLSSDYDHEFASNMFQARQERDSSLRYRQCQFAVDCKETTKKLPSTVSSFDESNPSLLTTLPWTQDASALRMHDQMVGLFERWTSDDFTVALMLFFNQYSGHEIDWVKHSIDATWEKGPIRNAQEFYAMISKCGNCITDCIQDETCKACLDALNAVDTRDQVTSYRTVVSYESELLRDFSLCILQKNNIFGCDAEVPTLPEVKPIATWRGEPLTFESARSILVGHLDDEAAPEGGWKKDVSWEVACGANVAYDQFPSQNQIFYESVNGKDMWYDPVFRVETIDGRSVWCKRHYKVRDGPVPGTFRFSVLDNGITSNEFWTIVGVADDLSWIVFHYAGAAAAVGQRYLGGLLCTPDGALPSKDKQEEIWEVLRGAGIEPWELYVVNNDPNAPGAIAAGPPPLHYYLDGVRAAKEKRKAAMASN